MAASAGELYNAGVTRTQSPFASPERACKQQLPADHPDIATSLNLLGWVKHQRGRNAEAEPFLLEAIRIRRGREEHSVDGLSRSLNDLGVVYNSLHGYADAERVLREALEIRRVANGDANRSVGVRANKRDTLLIEVEALHREALSTFESRLGPQHDR